MKGKGLLQKIWNLEPVHRPAVIVEENLGYTPAQRIDLGDFESQFQNALSCYQYLLKGRDDNVPALNTAMGTFVFPTAFGAEIRTFEDGHRYIGHPVIVHAEDVDRLKPLPLTETILSQQIRLVEYFYKKTDGMVPIRIPDIQNPLGIAEMLWETNDFYLSLLDQPEKVHRLLEIITEVELKCISKLKNACPGIIPITCPLIWAPEGQGIHLSDDTMSMVSPDLYEEYGVRYNNVISREFGGTFLHSCTTNKRYFDRIIKNENLRSINFAAQYSTDMKDIFSFFGGKAVILPHYFHTDSPQIGTLPEFIAKVLDCWTPETPAIIYVSAKPGGGCQQEVFDAFKQRGYEV